MNVWIWLLAFSAMAALDVAWVLYMRASTSGSPLAASVWAGAIHCLSATAAIAYIGDNRYLTATLLGTVLGTYGIVEWIRRRPKA